MIKKLTDRKLSQLTGIVHTTFCRWKTDTKETRFKYESLMLGATLLHNGYSFDNILKDGKILFDKKVTNGMTKLLKKENELLTGKVEELEQAIHDYADKIEAIRELRK